MKLNNRKINIIRIIMSILFGYFAFYFDMKIYFYLSIVHLVFSLFWMAQTEGNLLDENKFEIFGYIPATIDSFGMTIAVSLTGHLRSFLIIGYVIIVLMTSLTSNKKYGVFAVISSTFLFLLSGILIKNNLFPIINVFGFSTPILWRELVASTVFIFGVLILLNRTIFDLIKKER